MPLDGVAFHPYYTVKDIFGVVFLTLFAAVVFFEPTFGGLFLEKENFTPADPLSTPGSHIAVLVLHALLRDPALVSRPARGRHGDAAGGGDFLFPALVGSLAGQIGALSRLDLQVSWRSSPSRFWR